MAAIADSPAGFRISNDHVISQLSGPVSIVILQPNYDSAYFKTYKKAPLFILFGDIHCSDKNLCEPSKGAIRIHDINFLNMMCSIIKDNEVIDVCTEGENLTNQTNITTPTREPIYAFHNLVRYCNTLNKTHDDYQKIQKIRWHHTDIRFWTLNIPEVQKVREDRPRNYYNMFEFLSIRVEGNKHYKDKPTSDIFFRVFRSYLSKLIAAGYSFEANIAVNVTEIYFKLVENRYSLINYQISKITKKSDREFLKQKISVYISYMYQKELQLSGLKESKDLGQLIRTMHNKMIGFCNGDLVGLKEIHGTPEYTIYKNFILRIETIKLDIFTFAKSFTRMLNPTPDKQPPIINMCYFGNLHIQNMTYFITKILNAEGVGGNAYNVILTHGIGQDAPNPLSKDANRCLDFSQIKKSSISELLNQLRQMSISK